LPIPVSPERLPERGLRVVAIGGGTGLSTLLRGLKRYVGTEIEDLAAIVTVTDDGGSSGRLRKEFNILPPGDIRNCMVALSEDEGLLAKLFQYRFPNGSNGLGGHNFGNLFLTAFTAVVGDFAEAVRESSQILASRGHIYPSTRSNVQLDAWMADGSRVRGETNITASHQRIVQLRMVPANAKPLPEALEAIAKADVITIGPGSLFTSLAPNLLVRGIPEAIRQSKAAKIFVCNLMQQANESLGMTASQHLQALRGHAGGRVFDYALVNTAPVSTSLAARYRQQKCEQVQCDRDAIERLGVKCVEGDFLEEAEVVRHNTNAIARKILQIGRNPLARTANA
jgi:uncharacterized cofD-like protein